MRDLLNIIQEGSTTVQGQYILATQNLETGAWRVTFHPSRELAHVAYEQWSSAFTGDAYITPVELALHADADARSSAVGRRNAAINGGV